jgi:UPF0716 protein FxsA
MALLILVVLIGLPIMEIAVFIEAGERIGLWPTVGAILATAVIGLSVIRIQGLAVLDRARGALARDEFPGLELFDGLCLLIAGGLLITPGFITDSFGFLLLIVPLRRAVGALVWRHMRTRGYVVKTQGEGADVSSVIIEGEYRDVSERETIDPKRRLDRPAEGGRSDTGGNGRPN